MRRSSNSCGFGMTNLAGLDSDQLRERLLVAETIMKKLFIRNKELEEFHKVTQDTNLTTTNVLTTENCLPEKS